jgi:tRNA 2-thiouridine synthesizing protein A
MTANQMTPTRELDTTGLNCPLPILKTRKELKTMHTGDVLKLISSDVGSLKDIEAFCNQTGHGLLSSAQEANSYVYHIRKN